MLLACMAWETDVSGKCQAISQSRKVVTHTTGDYLAYWLVFSWLIAFVNMHGFGFTYYLAELRLAVQAIPPVCAHFSVAWSFCLLSVVCHIRVLCLNCSTDFDVIWQAHLWGPMTHCVRWGSLTPRRNGGLGSNPQPKHAVANCSQTVSAMLPPGKYKPGAIPPSAKLVSQLSHNIHLSQSSNQSKRV